MACSSGSSNLAGDDPTGQDTTCNCNEDYHVEEHTCIACPSGQSNLAGDDASGPNTLCDTCRITTNQELNDHVNSWIADPSSHACGPVIGEWEVGRVTDMSDVFCACVSSTFPQCNAIRASFDADLSNWNTASVTTLSRTFCGTTRFTGESLANWNTYKVTSMYNTFGQATSFNAGIEDWNTSNVKSMYSTFEGATSFTGAGIEKWDGTFFLCFFFPLLNLTLKLHQIEQCQK